jgi:antitoxin VapB
MLAIPTETETMARRLAAKFGKTPEDLISDLIAERAHSVGLTIPDDPSQSDAMLRAREILLQYRQLPLLDQRTPDEILAYDENGLPA